MSHFSVMVVGDDVDKAMAPYQENNEGTCPDEFLQFTDKEDELREEWAENAPDLQYQTWHPSLRQCLEPDQYRKLSTEGVVDIIWPADTVMPLAAPESGQRWAIEPVCGTDGQPAVKVLAVDAATGEIRDKTPAKDGTAQIYAVISSCVEQPAEEGGPKRYALGLTLIPPPVLRTPQEKYASFDAYVADCYGYRQDPKTGRYGYWSNPQSYWDWWVIGGRFSNALKLKPEAMGEWEDVTDAVTAAYAKAVRYNLTLEELFNCPDPRGKTTRIADIAKTPEEFATQVVGCAVKDGRIGVYTRSASQRGRPSALADAANMAWLLRQQASGWTNQARAGAIDWDAMCRGSDSRRKAAGAYWDVNVEGKKPETPEEQEAAGFCIYKPEYFRSRYGNREAYIDAMCAFSTYAVVKDGEWHSQGAMGMFGCSDEAEGAAYKWAVGFKSEFIDKLRPDDLVTIVDCHI